MSPFRPLAIAAFSLAALSLVAAPPRPVPRTLIESEPFVVTGELPDGWTADAGRIAPPEALRSACRVTSSLLQGSEWKTVVAAAMRDVAPAFRQLQRIGGHETAEYRTSSGSRVIDAVYINLDSIEPAGVAIWRAESDNDAAGRQCATEFALLVHTLAIQLPESPAR
ncbi:MAG TPA: hypothetical protein VGJ81_01580 [Thermoanaerobaculia bacterium]